VPDVELWYPHAVRDPCDPALWGRYTDAGEPKFLLHTTEGNLGAYTPDPRLGQPARRYYGHTHWPTYTLAYAAPLVWRVHQHMPADRAARALANRAGGVETNRANVTQVEIAGRAAEIAVFAATGGMDALAELLAWEHEVRRVPLVSSVRWVGAEGYGETAPQRLGPAAWVAYAGVCGHQHAPGVEGNSHWDPGKFPVGDLLQRAREHLAPPEEDEMPLTPEEIRAVGVEAAVATMALLRAQMWETATPPKQAHAGAVLRRDYEMTGETFAAVARIEAALSRDAPMPAAVTLDAVHAALDGAVDHDALLGIAEHAMAAARAIRSRPPVLPPTEA
jgi:hypothetical protein